MKLSTLALLAGATSQAATAEVAIKITDPAKATFALEVDSAVWLNSGDTRFYVDGAWHAASDGSLKLTKYANSTGADDLGRFDETVVSWTAGTTEVETSYKVYNREDDGFVVFEQRYPNGANNTGTGDRNNVNSAFPSFKLEDGPTSNPRGYLVYSGCMLGDAHVGGWDAKTGGIKGGLEGGPIALFDNTTTTTLVLSSYSQFMASSYAVQEAGSEDGSSSNSVEFGLIGTMDPIPAGYSTSFVAYVGNRGVNAAFADWGSVLLNTYGKTRATFESDQVLNYLGYSTDNGAYYYYHTEGETGRWKTASNMEPTLSGVKEYADAEHIPYNYILLDSWWYPKDANGDGVITWVAMPEVFPSGLPALWKNTTWPVMGHNRFWSTKTTYAKQNGGDYEFEIAAGDKMAMPLEQRFWDDLLLNSSEWGLITYEQDWLYNEFEGVTRATTDVNLARNWLLQMGRGAERNHMTIQYCMPYPRHVLQSVEIQAVTNFRASGDYSQDRSDQWHVGQSAIIAHSLALGPSKDNYWSVAEQPGNNWGSSKESRSLLQSAVSSYSTGPVAPSDRIKYSDAAMINRACNTEGKLIKPSKAATAIDATFSFRAGLTKTGPDGEVWGSFTEFPDGPAYLHVLVADLKSDYAISPSALHHGGIKGQHVAFSHPLSSFDANDIAVQQFDEAHPIQAKKCGEQDFQLFHSAPVLNVSTGWAVLGEVAKWVPVSADRITNIEQSTESLTVDVVGGVRENVTFAFYDVKAAKVVTVPCSLSAQGTATFNLPAATCTN